MGVRPPVRPLQRGDRLLHLAARAGTWKLVVNGAGADNPDGGPPPKKAGRDSVELFDLAADPYEKANLAEKHPDKVKELQAELAGFAKQAVLPKARPKPDGFASPKVWGEPN